MKTVIFSARGLLPNVMSWNKDEQNMGARPMAGNSRREIKPQGRRKATAGMNANIDMRRSWRWGSVAEGWWAMAVLFEVEDGRAVFSFVDVKVRMSFEMQGRLADGVDAGAEIKEAVKTASGAIGCRLVVLC